MTKFQEHPDYEKLPDVLKAIYTREEYAWLGNEGRARMLEVECYPEPTED